MTRDSRRTSMIKAIRSLQRWTTGSVQPVTVDFLIPPNEETDKGGLIHYIESDFAAIITPGLELAFGDRSWAELCGHIPSGAWATRNIPVCGPGAFTVLKALAFGNRAENKDAYDLFYVWNGIGVTDVAKSLAPLLPNTNIDNALCIIERDFCSPNGPGPIGAAHFIALRGCLKWAAGAGKKCHSERSRRICVRLAVTPCPPTPRPFAFAQGYKRTF